MQGGETWSCAAEHTVDSEKTHELTKTKADIKQAFPNQNDGVSSKKHYINLQLYLKSKSEFITLKLNLQLVPKRQCHIAKPPSTSGELHSEVFLRI